MKKQSQTSDATPGLRTTPLYKEVRYTKFYLTMLILSTMGTAAGLLNLVALPQTLNDLPSNPVNSVASLIDTFLVLPLSITALVFLWRKHILGLWLKLGAYILSLLSIALSLTVIDQTIRHETALAVRGLAQNDGTRELTVTLMTTVIYISIGAAIVTSITFCFLWWFAWKNQAAADADE